MGLNIDAIYAKDDAGNVTGLVGPGGVVGIYQKDTRVGSPRELLTDWDWTPSLQREYAYLTTLTPTKYFDPDASGSANTGTLANPYNSVATLSSYISGSIPGAIIGFKRGTKTRGAITGVNLTGTAVAPVIFTPYGDALAMPEITGLIVTSGWSRYSGDIYAMPMATNSDLFEFGIRVPRATGGDLSTIIGAMQAAAPGVIGWISGTAYIRTIDGASPNGGQIQAQNVNRTLEITYPNSSGCGNIIIAGLKIVGSRDSSLFIHGQSGATNSPSFVQIVGNVLGNCGVSGGSGSSDGLLLNGVSDSIRLTDAYVGGNYSVDTMNNAFEINGMNSSVFEYNEAVDFGGNLLELYSSCSLNKIRYNRGLSVKANVYGGGYYQGGIWIAANELLSSGAVQVDTSNDSSLSNVIHHNLLVGGISGGLVIDTGHSNLIHHNTTVSSPSASATTVKMASPHATGNTITNNAFLTWGNQAHVWYKAACAVLSGDNNFLGSIDSRVFKAAYVHNNGTAQTSLANYKAQCQIDYPGLDQNSVGGDPRTTRTGQPLPGSPLISAGKTGLGYAHDINGVALASTPSIGCFEI